MPSTIARLTAAGLVNPPAFLPDNVHYETMMGSVAYGVSGDTSDIDVYGFAIPPKHMLFPHLAGEIPGFGRQAPRFEQFQEHHVAAPDDLGGRGRQYDLAIFSIVKYFALCMENNPNMIDSLFTPQSCVLHLTRVGAMVRDQRKLFVHKGCWPKFKGYAYAQLHKMQGQNPQGKRKELREKFGFDVKFAYHVARLLNEAEQLLMEGELDLQRNNEQLKAIRRGDVPEEEIRRWAAAKEHDLEKAYHASSLPQGPPEDEIKKLLLHCLEEHYGNLQDAVAQPDEAVQALREVQEVLRRHRRLLER